MKLSRLWIFLGLFAVISLMAGLIIWQYRGLLAEVIPSAAGGVLLIIAVLLLCWVAVMWFLFPIVVWWQLGELIRLQRAGNELLRPPPAE